MVIEQIPPSASELQQFRQYYESFSAMIRPHWSWNLLQRAFAFVLGAAVVVAAYAGWQYWLYKGGIFRTSSFDQAEWQALNGRTGDFSCYRGGMASDIQTKILRPGLSKSQVEKLLGSPDISKVGVHEYALGMCSGLRIDLDTLDVHFNAEDRIEKVLIVQH